MAYLGFSTDRSPTRPDGFASISTLDTAVPVRLGFDDNDGGVYSPNRSGRAATQPSCVVVPSDRMTRQSPATFTSCNSTTVMHIVASKRRVVNKSGAIGDGVDRVDKANSDFDLQISRSIEPLTLSGHGVARNLFSSSSGSSSSGSKGFPVLTVSQCSGSTMYLLMPYSSASINSCSDSEIVVGAVAGAVIVSGCERVRISVACRKLVIHNCLDCIFNVATLSTSTISGDSRSLVFGPHNVNYKGLSQHLQMVSGDNNPAINNNRAILMLPPCNIRRPT